MTMPQFKILFTKTVYAMSIITAETEGKAELLAWKEVDKDKATNGQVLDWGGLRPGLPNYTVTIKDDDWGDI
jgi:hypothetical protein